LTRFTYPRRRKGFQQLVCHGNKYSWLKLLNIWNNFENFLINSKYLNSSLLVGPVFISECWPLILRKTILRFCKYWSSSHGFNKLVIKSKIWFLYKKMHAKIFFNFCVYKKNVKSYQIFYFIFLRQNIIFIFWETWPYAHQIKIIFCIILRWEKFLEILEIFEVSMKNEYFNTRLVSYSINLWPWY